MTNRGWLFEGKNATGEGNDVILEAEGAGHYVDCNINIHNLHDPPNGTGPAKVTI